MKKRFIAGAVCPSCKAMDRIVLYKKGEQEFQECVACGYSQQQHIQSVRREMETRVNTPEDVIQAETQVLNFSREDDLDPKSKTD